MIGYANVQLAGNITRDLEVRYRPGSGEPVCQFSVAVNRSVATGADFIDCEATSLLAEEMSVKFRKGSPVHVTGRLVQKRWEVKGRNMSRLVVQVSGFEEKHDTQRERTGEEQ